MITNNNPKHEPTKCITLKEFLDGMWKRIVNAGDIPTGLCIDYVSLGGLTTQTPTAAQAKDYRLTSYEFDVRPILQYGSSEGIYIDIDLVGRFNLEAGDGCRMYCGCIKTLESDKDTMRKMGELCGMIVYHSRHFINERIDEFDGSGIA